MLDPFAHGLEQPQTDAEQERRSKGEAISESIHEYSEAIREYRDMFLAVLGHDLRSSLEAVLNASEFLTDGAELSAAARPGNGT